MGSTGHGSLAKYKHGKVDHDTFNIKGAIVYKGKIPEGKGLEPVGSNKVTLKVPITGGNSIIFQFKLTKDKEDMLITAYKNGVPEVRCKVAVDSGNPSLNTVLKEGNKSQKAEALKMKDLFAKSTDVKENQLGAIANKLLQKKKV